MSTGAADRDERLAYYDRPRGQRALWFGMLAGPAAWFAHLNVSFGFTRFACESGGQWVAHAATVAALALAGAGVWVAWRAWRRIGRPAETTGEGTLGRSRFMAIGGVAMSGFFLLVILVAWVPPLLLDSCSGSL